MIQKTEYLLSKYKQRTRMQNIKSIFSFLAVQLPKNQVKVMTSLLETLFLAFHFGVLHKNKWCFWNPETKLDKIGMLL